MTTSYAGATVEILESLGLDPATDGPLIEWRTGPAAWTPDPNLSHSLISFGRSYGRTDAISKVTPAQVTVTAAAAIADPPEIGAVFRLALCDPAATVLGLDDDEAALFTGEVTDMVLDPARRTWQVVAVHQEARQARTVVPLVLLPAATLHDRVVAVLAAIGATAGTIDAGGQVLTAPDALAAGSALLDGASDAAPGTLVPQLDGDVDWHGREHRRGTPSSITLDDSEILNDLTWSKHVGSLVNVCTINYTGGSVTVTDPASVAADGAYPLTITTSLAARAAAFSLATLIVGRRAAPAWTLPVLNVDVARTVDGAHLADLLKLRHSDRLTVAGLPATHPVEGTADFYLEGLNDTATARQWKLGLAVSDPTLSGISIRWIDLATPTYPPVTLDGGDAAAAGPYDVEVDGGDAATSPDIGGLDWDHVDPAIRWIDVARIEDPVELGDYGHRTYDGGMAA